MAYKDILKNGIRTFEDLEKWLTKQKARVDPRLRERPGGLLISARNNDLTLRRSFSAPDRPLGNDQEFL